MRFEAVIFDLFGTLIDNFSKEEHKRILTSMASALCISADPFIRLWFETFNMRCLGELKTIEENIIYICNDLNAFPNRDQMEKAKNVRFNFTKDSLVPKKKAIETLKAIKRLGYKVALISDCSSEVPVLWGETPFSEIFDISVFSCKIGIKKPNIEIYKFTCDELNVSPDRCLYVGDGSSNELSGAESAGMTPLLFQDPNEKDAHRIDEEIWKGNQINDIIKVMDYL